MNKTNFTQYDEYSEAMLVYLRNYGPHFNRKLYEFAVTKMWKRNKNETKKLATITKLDVDNILKSYNIELENNQLYDAAYVANMCKADFFGSSIVDEKHMALYVKDVIDDVDAEDGMIFNRWYADMCYKGIAIDWEEMI